MKNLIVNAGQSGGISFFEVPCAFVEVSYR